MVKKNNKQTPNIPKPDNQGSFSKDISVFKTLFNFLDASKQWISLALSIAAIAGSIYIYFSSFYTENLALKNQIFQAEAKYQKSINKAKLEFESQLRALHAQHIKQLREEDREHDRELREVYALLGKAQNKTDRVKIERDLFSFALGIEKGGSRPFDPLEKLNRLRENNLENIKKSIETHKKLRKTKRSENDKLKAILKDIEEKDMEVEAEIDNKIPSIK